MQLLAIRCCPLWMAMHDTIKFTSQKKVHIKLHLGVRTFEWVIMAFGLKNAGAIYQGVMNLIFHDFLYKFLEVYIDDVVVKSNSIDKHLHHLRQTFERMRRYNLKINPLKCAFGVTAGNFLGFWCIKRGLKLIKQRLMP